MNHTKTLISAAVLATAPFAAQAVTTMDNLDERGANSVSNSPYFLFGIAMPGEAAGTLSYSLQNDTASSVRLSGEGFSSSGIDGLSFSFDGVEVASVASGSMGIFEYMLDSGDTVAFDADYGATEPDALFALFGFSIEATAIPLPAAVPLPAGALLLVTAIGGVAAARRRRKAA